MSADFAQKSGQRCSFLIVPLLFVLLLPTVAAADGKIVPMREYAGSLEEKAQEAIIVFTEGDETKSAVEDLILKISVSGNAENFAWIVPFPSKPEIHKADAAMFAELFRYVQVQKRDRNKPARDWFLFGKKSDVDGVQVLSREIVGSYDVAVVHETEEGALNDWLQKHGYLTFVGTTEKETLEFYRKKNYVFACIKVAAAELKSKPNVDLHPLHFRFTTGGRDGIYFPMKLTGLQSDLFDVNLYVFHRWWLNDNISKFGFEHRGFQAYFRDWGAAKPFTNDSYKTVAAFMRKYHSGENFYLTNIQAFGLNPADIREWKDDLWLFPHYNSELFVPYDARPAGVASAGWPNQRVDVFGNDPDVSLWYRLVSHPVSLAVWTLLLILAATFLVRWLRRRRRATVTQSVQESPAATAE